MKTIKFYKIKDEHGHMSNFYPTNIEIEGHGTFKTSEHLYQAIKYLHNKKRFLEIQNASSPWVAAKLGRDTSIPIRNDWERIKNDAMRFTVAQKYKQNKTISKLLMDTHDSNLVEYAPHGDYYWGDGGDGTGKNILGLILQEVREVLNDQREFDLLQTYLKTEAYPQIKDIPIEAYISYNGKNCGI